MPHRGPWSESEAMLSENRMINLILQDSMVEDLCLVGANGGAWAGFVAGLVLAVDVWIVCQ